jgi:hypothetical protein
MSGEKVNITVDPTPPPPWSGVKFTCENDDCRAEYQLEAADSCQELPRMEFERRRFETPPCWDCGRVNVVQINAPNESQEVGNA